MCSPWRWRGCRQGEAEAKKTKRSAAHDFRSGSGNGNSKNRVLRPDGKKDDVVKYLSYILRLLLIIAAFGVLLYLVPINDEADYVQTPSKFGERNK